VQGIAVDEHRWQVDLTRPEHREVDVDLADALGVVRRPHTEIEFVVVTGHQHRDLVVLGHVDEAGDRHVVRGRVEQAGGRVVAQDDAVFLGDRSGWLGRVLDLVEGVIDLGRGRGRTIASCRRDQQQDGQNGQCPLRVSHVTTSRVVRALTVLNSRHRGVTDTPFSGILREPRPEDGRGVLPGSHIREAGRPRVAPSTARS
jgi:hypothetical protein